MNDLTPAFDTYADEIVVPTQSEAMDMLIKQDALIRTLKKQRRRLAQEKQSEVSKWKGIASAFAKENKKAIKNYDSAMKLLDRSEKDKKIQTDLLLDMQDEIDRLKSELSVTKLALEKKTRESLASLPDEKLDKKFAMALFALKSKREELDPVIEQRIEEIKAKKGVAA